MKHIKRPLLIFVVLFLIAIPIGSILLFEYGLSTKVTPDYEKHTYARIKKYDYMEQWIDSLDAENAILDTLITARDGAKLHGLYIDAAKPSNKTALLIHGYVDNAIGMMHIALLFNRDLGYNVVLPDLRAHGKSDGNYIQMGWNDRLDVLEWVHLATQLYGDTTQIAIHGISMGAATAMMLSGENNLPSQVKVFVEDCGYTSVWDEFSEQLNIQFGLPKFPFIYTANWYTQWKEDWGFREASSVAQVAKSTLPMLFIHGDVDTFVPTWMVHELYAAKTMGDKELWLAPNTGHAVAYFNHKEEYTNRVGKFVEKYIK